MFKKDYDYKYFLVKYFPFIKHRFVVFRAVKTCFGFLRHLPGSSIYFGPPRGIYLNTQAHNSTNTSEPITEILLRQERSYIRELPPTNSSYVVNKFKHILKTTFAKNFSHPRQKTYYRH